MKRWSLTLCKGERFRVFENRVLWGIVGLGEEELKQEDE
jgi:hypothetical protein